MDFSIIVVLLVILYIVPEILRRRRGPQDYKYPDLPVPKPPEELHTEVPVHAAPANVSPTYATAVPSFLAMGNPLAEVSRPLEVTSFGGEQYTGAGLDRNTVVNGIIFAEILKPPRALVKGGGPRHFSR